MWIGLRMDCRFSRMERWRGGLRRGCCSRDGTGFANAGCNELLLWVGLVQAESKSKSPPLSHTPRQGWGTLEVFFVDEFAERLQGNQFPGMGYGYGRGGEGVVRDGFSHQGNGR